MPECTLPNCFRNVEIAVSTEDEATWVGFDVFVEDMTNTDETPRERIEKFIKWVKDRLT
jgi:hypothetical protein